MQVASEPVGLDLGGSSPDPVLRPPGGQTVAFVPSRGLRQRAEEGVDAQAVSEHVASSVAVIGDPGQVRGSNALGLGDLGKAELGEDEARRRPPLPETPPRSER